MGGNALRDDSKINKTLLRTKKHGSCFTWRYFDEKDRFTEYYDETFIILDTAGDRVVSREELRELIGENQNIYYGQYGVGVERPME